MACDIGIDFGAHIFIGQRVCSFLMRRVTQMMCSQTQDLCPQIAYTVGKLFLTSIFRWAGCIDKRQFEAYSLFRQANPHRHPEELQALVAGFNQYELTPDDLPAIFSTIIGSANTPFYSGQYAFYSNLLYVVSSMMVERSIIPREVFQPLHMTHSGLARKMNITEELDLAFKEIHQVLRTCGVQKWRYRN